tara:strand:+ start:1309 stop:3516 length:2208 start_codon:yes stop_codon:yes gene_type:complete
MPQKVFQRIGIRRDNNLSDVGSAETSLNNLLNGLVTKASPAKFISQDLDAIRNIWNINLDSTGYQAFIDSATESTESTGGGSAPVSPAITYQNKLDKFRVFTGEPRLAGGNGLTAKYYDSTQINENSTDIFSGTPYKQDNFWQRGHFNYTDKLHPASADSDGGILWEGFFIPTQTGIYNLSISSNNCFTFDFEKESYHNTGSGTKYDEIKRILHTKTVSGSNAAGVGNNIIISAADTVNVAIGMSASNSGTNQIAVDAKVSDINTTTGGITFEKPDGSNSVAGNFSGNVTFTKVMGQDTSISHSTYVLKETEKYSIRYRYFIPSSLSSNTSEKSINFSYNRSGDTGTGIPFYLLYGTDYDFSDAVKGDFATFLDTSILFGGGQIGLTDAGGTPSSKNDYVKVSTTKKFDIKYQPKTSYSDIERKSASYTTVNGSPILSITDTSNIEVGNRVFGTGIANDTIVQDISINNFVILDKNMTASGSNTVTFIDHRGFVKNVTGSTSGTTLTISSGDTVNLRTDMLLICNGSSSYTGITTTGNSSEVNIFPSQTIGANTEMYFYQSRGLINDSLGAFCTPEDTECLVVTTETNSPATTIPVSGTAALDGSATYRVLGSQFAANTQITTINTNNIVINNNTTAKLLVGEKVTVTKESSDITERVLCCPPLDTSPPFTPTEDGLATKAIRPNMKVDNGNIKFDSLTATGIGTITALSTDLSEASNNKVTIDTPSGTFKIMCE